MAGFAALQLIIGDYSCYWNDAIVMEEPLILVQRLVNSFPTGEEPGQAKTQGAQKGSDSYGSGLAKKSHRFRAYLNL
jgi:hypothetical protein